MRERGKVSSVGAGMVSVEMESSAECESCGVCSAGAGGARVLDGVIDEHRSQVGDVVEVETPLGARRAAQTLVYVVPVVALVAGYVAGFLLSSWAGFATPDSAGAVAAIVAGIGAFLWLRRRNEAFDAPSARPRVRAIIARGHDDSGTPPAPPSDRLPSE